MSDYEPKCKKTLPIIFDDRMPASNLTPKLVNRVNNNTEDLKNLYEDAITHLKQDINELEEGKADASGTSENLTAGNAEQLLTDKGITDKVPYLLRASGGNGADREVDKIVGGTVAWNQLVDTNTTSVTIQSDHKYYSKISGTASISASTGATISVTGGTDNVTDLTQMFGTAIADRAYAMEQATAGSGINWLKSMGFFTKDYYPYDAGSLKSVEGLTAHSMVGFNQWDEEWEQGNIDPSTGQNTPGALLRSKNYIPVLPNTEYYANVGTDTTSNFVWFEYDANKNYLGEQHVVDGGHGTFAISKNAYYIRFRLISSYGTTYNHNICINLSDSAKNGTYEPYVKHSYPLDSTLTLRGIPKLDSNNRVYYDGDEYASDGTVTRRYGIVDLGTLNWVRYNFSDTYAFYAAIDGRKSQSEKVVCAKYPHIVASPEALVDKTMNAAANGAYIYIRDDSYTDAATFKAAMSGVYLVYELATPTTEEADPFQNPQIVDPYGTEEYVTTGIVPVGHETFYPENLRSKIEGLPFNFATLIAPTELTYKATRAYSANNLFIVDNILYKATTSIASGGTITPGTNCTATTLAEIIAALS